MNNQEYIIINKTILLKKIEELKKEYSDKAQNHDDQWCSLIAGKIVVLKEVLSQSTPLIPEIEKAFDAGNKRSWSGYPNTDNWTQPNKQDYISNLKLEI